MGNKMENLVDNPQYTEIRDALALKLHEEEKRLLLRSVISDGANCVEQIIITKYKSIELVT
jgi:hypothetical protein